MQGHSQHWKFGIGIALIVGVALWGAVSGFQQSKMYYVTVQELVSGKTARKRIRVGGTVESGSIVRSGSLLRFRLVQNAVSIPVVYVGSETLPDTFKDGSKAIVEGEYTSAGTFRAEQVQAKCASKYVTAPPGPKRSNVANTSDLAKELKTGAVAATR
ncbi:MAG TPA: cytochrome c maturation protein CcmE [Terriglobia bacterium]|nr:cytochrome c maturation protein CcmE [Terriglobia bacterium]